MGKSHLSLVTPTTVLGTVATPRRKPNAELRPREYLTEDELERLRKAAGGNRNGFRDATMILVAFRHGLRPSELVTLRCDAIDLDHGTVHCNRRKNGAASISLFVPLVVVWALYFSQPINQTTTAEIGERLRLWPNLSERWY